MIATVKLTLAFDQCANEAEARRRWADVLAGLDRLMEASQNVIYRSQNAMDIDDFVTALFAARVTLDAPTSSGALHPSQRGGV